MIALVCNLCGKAIEEGSTAYAVDMQDITISGGEVRVTNRTVYEHVSCSDKAMGVQR